MANYFKYIVFVLMLSIVAACSPNVTLFNKLSEDEANEVYSVLLRSGFDVQKTRVEEGFIIEVPQSMAGEALDLLAAKGLPRDRKNSINEIFPDNSMISSPLQEKARYLYALSQELEHTLMTIDGVIEARVHIVLPERSVSSERLTPSSVAVFVKHNETSSFPAYLSQIRELIVSSIPSMSRAQGNIKDSVSIVAIPVSGRLEQPLSLIWFGPFAIKTEDRVYFLSLIYGLIGLWSLSIGAIYLAVVEPSRRPQFLQKLLKSKEEDEEEDVDAEDLDGGNDLNNNDSKKSEDAK